MNAIAQPINETNTAMIPVNLEVKYNEKTGTMNVVNIVPSQDTDALYVPVAQAAKIAGVAYSVMAAWADRLADPIPHIRSGKKRLIRRSAIEEYARKQEFRR